MTAGIIDESAIAEALRLGNTGERAKQILNFQGLGLWHGDLSEMRRDSPPRSAALDIPATGDSGEANQMVMLLRIKAALNRLPAKEREVLNLKYFDNLQIDQVAERLGLDATPTRALIQRALQHVRKLYEDSINKSGGS
jgi:RNA polymerase sigma factor (sigma-70 family)